MKNPRFASLNTSNKNKILFDGAFTNQTAVRTILLSRGIDLTLGQIRRRNANRTLHDRTLDQPVNQARLAAIAQTKQCSRQAMLDLITSLDAAKLKLKESK